MILSGPQIEQEVRQGTIEISPFDRQNLNPNSYNFHLGTSVTCYVNDGLDAQQDNPTYTMPIPKEGLLLEPHKLYLGHIAERIGSQHFVPIIKGRSSIGRLGLFIVITADLIDLGAFGCWTLQMHAVQPVMVYPGMAIGQMTFWKISGKPLLYSGKYQNATGPMASQSYKDFR